MSDNAQKAQFEAAATQRSSGLLSEILGFLKQNKKYWLLPIVILLLGFGVLVILGGSAAAPFIYTLF